MSSSVYCLSSGDELIAYTCKKRFFSTNTLLMHLHVCLYAYVIYYKSYSLAVHAEKCYGIGDVSMGKDSEISIKELCDQQAWFKENWRF